MKSWLLYPRFRLGHPFQENSTTLGTVTSNKKYIPERTSQEQD